jgi:peptidoglycan/xylan/chitin deacetylase (PgdA/CDA1 family)
MNRRTLGRITAMGGLLVALLVGGVATGEEKQPADVTASVSVPILVYHRFGPTAADRMTTPTAVFEAQLHYLRDHGYTVIQLRQLVDYLLRQAPAPAPPRRAVVITADDGHRSVYTELFPLAVKYRLPVTLFIYPSAISNAAYALTWEQLREMRASGLFDIQSHTYWHPNFRQEQRRLSVVDYERLVTMQLTISRQTITRELGGEVDLLAWPFGIHDPWLMQKAREAGYLAAFTIEPRPATATDDLMAIPRFLLTDGTGVRGFAGILTRPAAGR